MSDRITTAEMLRLAREALADDKSFTLSRGTPSRDNALDQRRMLREPALARFVEAMFGAESSGVARRAGAFIEILGWSSRLTPSEARRVAADLWLAADEAESKEGR